MVTKHAHSNDWKRASIPGSVEHQGALSSCARGTTCSLWNQEPRHWHILRGWSQRCQEVVPESRALAVPVCWRCLFAAKPHEGPLDQALRISIGRRHQGRKKRAFGRLGIQSDRHVLWSPFLQISSFTSKTGGRWGGPCLGGRRHSGAWILQAMLNRTNVPLSSKTNCSAMGRIQRGM